MSLEALIKELKVRGGFEAVNQVSSDTRIQLYGRVRGESVDRMLMVCHSLLQLDGDGVISCDLSRQYILKDKKMVYRWRLIFQAVEIDRQITTIISRIKGAPVPQTELTEHPLTGATADRGAVRNGKGVQAMGSAKLLPSMRMR